MIVLTNALLVGVGNMARAPAKRTMSAKAKDKKTKARKISARKEDLDKKKTFLKNGKRPKAKAKAKRSPMNFKKAAEARKKRK